MVKLSSPHDYVVLFALAALFGAIGGVAYELTQNRSGRTGLLSLPSLTKWSFVGLGFTSSMLLGAVAAIAVSYFFTPETQVKEMVGHTTQVVTEWQIVKVIPLSLIVGSSGGAFLEAMRSRVLNQMKVAGIQAAARASVIQVAQVAKTATTAQSAGAARTIVSRGREPIAAAASELPEQLRVGLSELPSEAFEPGQIAGLLEAQPEPRPVDVHVERLSEEVQGALDDATRAASSLIDASVESALQSIDAAATGTST